jgi:hypothetical protein
VTTVREAPAVHTAALEHSAYAGVGNRQPAAREQRRAPVPAQQASSNRNAPRRNGAQRAPGADAGSSRLLPASMRNVHSRGASAGASSSAADACAAAAAAVTGSSPPGPSPAAGGACASACEPLSSKPGASSACDAFAAAVALGAASSSASASADSAMRARAGQAPQSRALQAPQCARAVPAAVRRRPGTACVGCPARGSSKGLDACGR